MFSRPFNTTAIRAFQTNVSAQIAKKSGTNTLRKTLLKEQSPRRPPAVYALYLKSIMPSVRSEHPNATFVELSRLANNKWKSMSDHQKKPYYDESHRLFKEYHSARAEIEKTLPPKRPSTGFILFCNDVRPHVAAEHPLLKTTDIVRLLGEKWKALPFDKKNRYLDLAARNREQWKLRNGFLS
ncbi:AFL219Wp [Eremothecium gossypii ATCC 10895]|uniref:AFL219Wp n=1 Tax=Eremothecium gossypii (strain ATCC 10895 / CBS 109.51 / FGSC 9923 / NRRL Y-1056) TaxID=284811 RepID=Q755N3_EREGS|nr:AFL219Wp [Eremothecium gossypii ATCC 10895]AAS53155.1 AFL219Wp [Eremothecium gossypii ATCC 10895]AEY97465.1 FAFL219Wp [Eremothecium gossypii FDAG1]